MAPHSPDSLSPRKRLSLPLNPEESESGFLEAAEADCYIGSAMRDVEVLHVRGCNIIARGRRYGRQWLIKGLREEYRDSVTMRRQLLKEFEIHSRLRHPNIVQAVALEEIEGLGLCIVQEWVEGPTLHEALRNNSLSSSERMRVVRELIQAVDYLHRNGVVHRDIKPSNVILREIGYEVVLIDFGLADSDDYVEIKQPGGTSGFVSPEQLESGGAEASDDVYSLGVVMGMVSPRYHRIAARCTGPLSRRPKDAGQLLRAIKRRDHRPKIILMVISAFFIIILSGYAIWRLVALEHAAYASQNEVVTIREENSRSAALVTTLKDSLAQLRGRLHDTEKELTEINEYEKLSSASLEEGYRKIDKMMSRFDRERFSNLSRGALLEYNEVLIATTRDVQNGIDAYLLSLKKTKLKPEDIDRIKTCLYIYVGEVLLKYQEKWRKEIISED